MENISKYLESTNLKLETTTRDVKVLVDEAVLHGFFGVCILPKFIETVKLFNSSIRIITVLGYLFPVEYICRIPQVVEKADELDLVLDVGAFLGGNSYKIIRDIKEIRRTFPEKVLKVIVETTKLTDENLIKVVGLLNDLPIDFIKTNLGFWEKERKRSLEEDVQIIKENIRDGLGIKASGGIKTLEQVQHLIKYGANRIGTSSATQIAEEYIQSYEK